MIKTTRYFSYLLRIWQPENELSDEWHASLEDPKSREVIYFKNLDQMLIFLSEIQTLKETISIPKKNKENQAIMEKSSDEE
jgi:hypothetical protein